MSAVPDATQHDILLSSDVLGDIGSSGRSFEKQIWDQGGPVSVSKISLDRTEKENVFSLRITVVGKDAETKVLNTVLTQTSQDPGKEMSAQTVDSPKYHSSVQTRPAVGAGTFQQTDVTPTSNAEMQTIRKVFLSTEMQTNIPALKEAHVQAQPVHIVSSMQTEFLGQAVQVQTDNPTNTAETQTIIKKFVDTGIVAKETMKDMSAQTTREHMHDIAAETDPMIVIDPEKQCENDSQTDFVRVIDPNMEKEMNIQTDDCKVIYPQNMSDMDVQTDFMRVIDPALDCEAQIQTDEKVISELEVQTDAVDIREVTESIEVETQTQLVWVWNLQQSQEEEVPVPAESDAAQPQSEMAPTESSSQESLNQTDLDMSSSQEMQPFEPTNIDLDQGKYVQTDPVTIIIGDSTFLVDRLKTYAKRQPAVRVVDKTKRKFGQKDEDGPPMLTPAGNQGDVEEPVREMPVLAAESASSDALYTPSGHRVYAPKKKLHPGPRKYTQTPTPPGQKYVPSFSHMKKPLEEKDLQPVSVKGRFDCPFCELYFGESAELYKHLQNTHGTPRASFRRSRRRGTIVITDDGESYVVGGGEPKPPKEPKKRRSAFETGEGSANLVQEIEVPYLEVPGGAEVQSVQLAGGEQIVQVAVQNIEPLEAEPVENGHEQEQLAVTTTQEAAPEDDTTRAFSCPMCPSTFVKSAALYVHLQNSHKTEARKLKSQEHIQDDGDLLQEQSTHQEETSINDDGEPEMVELQVEFGTGEQDAAETPATQDEAPVEDTQQLLLEGGGDGQQLDAGTKRRRTRSGIKVEDSESPAGKRSTRSVVESTETKRRSLRGGAVLASPTSPPIKRSKRK